MRSQQSMFVRACAAPLILFLVAASPLASADANCPVSIPETKLLGQSAPSPLRWFGSDSLAALLPPDGIWRGMGSDRNYADKLFWLAASFQPGMEGDFSVTGRKLDDDDSVLQPLVSGVTNARHDSFGGWTVLTGLGFPTAGCWEVTGSFQGHHLTFVVRVVDTE